MSDVLLGGFAPWRESSSSFRSRPLNGWKFLLLLAALLPCVFQGLLSDDRLTDADGDARRVLRSEDADGAGNLTAVETAVVFSGGTSVREYEDDAALAGNATAEFVRGSDWGGGVGGVLHSLRAAGNTTVEKFYHYDGRGDVTTQSAAAGNIT